MKSELSLMASCTLLQLDTRTLDNPEVCMAAAVPVSGVTVAGPELPSLLAHCSARG